MHGEGRWKGRRAIRVEQLLDERVGQIGQLPDAVTIGDLRESRGDIAHADGLSVKGDPRPILRRDRQIEQPIDGLADVQQRQFLVVNYSRGLSARETVTERGDNRVVVRQTMFSEQVRHEHVHHRTPHFGPPRSKDLCGPLFGGAEHRVARGVNRVAINDRNHLAQPTQGGYQLLCQPWVRLLDLVRIGCPVHPRQVNDDIGASQFLVHQRGIGELITTDPDQVSAPPRPRSAPQVPRYEASRSRDRDPCRGPLLAPPRATPASWAGSR